jgi:hypothetical protein
MRTKNYALVGCAAAVGLLVATLTSKLIPPRLSGEVEVTNADIGIPGITKMYEGTITNHGFLPVRVTRCDFIDDSMAPGTMVAYAVQRWNENLKRWDTVVDMSGPEFCKPYPLGIIKARLVNGWLWPGQRLSTGEEATAARLGFSVGDAGRFVIFTGTTGVTTESFAIDEHPQTDANLRVRH